MRQRSRLTIAEQRDKTLRDGNLAALAQHPSWPDLVGAVDEHQRKLEERLLFRFRSGDEFDQRNIDYLRGFIQGMRWLVTKPNRAENELERYLKQQAEGG